MMALIPRIAAVSYLNTIPFIYGIRHAGDLRAELLLTPPALCASNFIDGNADIALLPSAVVPRLKDAELVTDFCIGAEGEVRTVVVVSNTPIEEVRRIWLDAHSRTSVQLTGYLAARRWKIAPQWLDMSDYAVLDTRPYSIFTGAIGCRFTLSRGAAWYSMRPKSICLKSMLLIVLLYMVR